MEQQRRTRTYTITKGPSQELGIATVSQNRERLSLIWFVLPSSERHETFLQIDGDEREITSAGISKDNSRLVVTIDYEPSEDGSSRGSHIEMTFTQLLDKKMRDYLSQCDVQASVDTARRNQPERKIHWCFTQTNCDLNYSK